MLGRVDTDGVVGQEIQDSPGYMEQVGQMPYQIIFIQHSALKKREFPTKYLVDQRNSVLF